MSMEKKYINSVSLRVLFFFLLLLAVAPAFANENTSHYLSRFHNGLHLYRAERWHDAAAEFRQAQEIAVNANDWAQALYWGILSAMALGDYGSAIRDMDELDRGAPNTGYTREMLYHRARAYYNYGYFEEAMILFQRYSDSVSSDDIEAVDRKAAAFFWIGECLYSMGHFDEAEKFYAWVITRYPNSPRVEVSTYRLDLIKHKKIESELLALLRWSHEESLRTSEDYQRRIRTYEHTLNVYQRRIAELTHGGHVLEQPADWQEYVEPEETVHAEIYTLPGNGGAGDNGRENIYRNEELLQRAMQLEGELQQEIRAHGQNSAGVH